ncbi:GTP-binding protein gtr2 [Vermiconidia calcicola]|uniref:GTP-binding protein gtr2 n=1 Tax=Vermiconidia calcicola TaxID=1690605 RepID=A0ACC3NYI4_9PEZI|nr:GTP-binding protein gtr2 [Vermiconidia calcicola]
MHTLFGENIRSPSPLKTPHQNPFELAFQPSVATSSTESSKTSPDQNEWLTHRLQNQVSATSYTHGEQPPPTKRKGNPRLLFMGMRRCGKSSVQKVVFQKLPPADTLYLETTNRIESASMQSFMHFESAEIPTQLPVLSPDFDHSTIFSNIGAVIWIIDSQDEYLTSISELLRVAVFLAEHYPRTNFEVFIHKTDGLSEEYKYDTFREVRQRVQDELSDYGYGDRSVSYYQTSIFDHSIFEAMSKVIMKLLPQLPAMETLLTKLCSTCRIQKAYLFDTVSKIYIATDASPTFLKDYEVCSDYVDVIVDIKQLYGWRDKSPVDNRDEPQHAADVSFVGESVVTFDRSGDTYIYAREISDSLSLLCLMGQGSGADKKVLIDYNVDILHDALLQVFKV